jgi:coenzyme PQQ precursor peptide PqqA
MGSIGDAKHLGGKSIMAWTTPDFQEIVASAEVTAYVYAK